MTRLLVGVVLALLLFGGTLAADAALSEAPQSSTNDEIGQLAADGFQVASLLPLVLVASAVLGATAILGRVG